MTPFDVLDTDIDRFILLCTYLVNLNGDETPQDTINEREESAAFWSAL